MAQELWTQALRFVPLAAASLSLTVFSVWARMTMQRTWREWLSNHLYDYWLKDDRYVRLRSAAADHQAPEFRIAEDARVATDLPVDLVLGLFQSLLNAVTFIGILWSVGDSLPIDLGGFVLIHSRLPRHRGDRLFRSAFGVDLPDRPPPDARDGGK